jgi:hypothetical protein
MRILMYTVLIQLKIIFIDVLLVYGLKIMCECNVKVQINSARRIITESSCQHSSLLYTQFSFS